MYYVTMQITSLTRKFRNGERNFHCDVVHITTKWVSSLTLDCNGVFAIKAYCVLTRRKSGPIETTLSGDAASCARQQKTMSTEWYTPEKEETLVDLWRDEPLLYSTTSKGYSNRNMKYAAVHRIAQHFDTTGNYNVVLRVYD